MSKKPTSKESLLFNLELLRRIPKNRKITANELYIQLKDAGFDKTIRTVQRQLEFLSGHFDIERDDRSKPYGYTWKEKAKGFNLPTMSIQESLVLRLSEQYIKNILPSTVMNSMDGFFDQTRTKLGPHTPKNLEREWLSKVRIVSETQPLLPPEIKSGVFEAVSYALFNNYWLKLDYTNAEDYSSEYEVMPLGLAQQGPKMYLVCRFKGYENERSLALHRINSAEAMSFNFDRPDDFDLEKYDNDGRFAFGDGEKIKLCFDIIKDAGKYLLETPLSTTQVASDRGSKLHIEAIVVDTFLLDQWVNSFGDEITNVKKKYLDKT